MIRLKSAVIRNFRAIEELSLPLDPDLNVLVGVNGSGKTSVLDAIGVGLGQVVRQFPGATSVDFKKKSDIRRAPQKNYSFLPYPVSWSSVSRASFVLVELEGVDGFRWIAAGPNRRGGDSFPIGLRRALKERLAPIVDAAEKGDESVRIPVIAAYQNSRAVLALPQRARDFEGELTRFQGLDGGLRATANFRKVIEWLIFEEADENKKKIGAKDFNFQLQTMKAVRSAVRSLLHGCNNIRTETRPPRVIVDYLMPGRNGAEILSLDQVSDGYRTMLALVLDLAYRMATINPFMENPLEAEGVVLIDEVDLHLHPKWQQRVLKDLRTVFPNIQFIVTTHSPQVLTSVEQKHIIILDRKPDGEITAMRADMDPYGAESGQVLEAIFGVEERPPEEINDFVRDLNAYWALVKENRFDEPEAKEILGRLYRRPEDPVLLRIDLETRRRRAMLARGQKP